MDISARRQSSPSIFKIPATFLYTSPTYGVSVPNIMPSKSETKTRGINNLVNLLRKVVIDWSVNLKFIIYISKSGRVKPPSQYDP